MDPSTALLIQAGRTLPAVNHDTRSHRHNMNESPICWTPDKWQIRKWPGFISRPNDEYQSSVVIVLARLPSGTSPFRQSATPVTQVLNNRLLLQLSKSCHIFSFIDWFTHKDERKIGHVQLWTERVQNCITGVSCSQFFSSLSRYNNRADLLLVTPLNPSKS